jgi:hypothetical protein
VKGRLVGGDWGKTKVAGRKWATASISWHNSREPALAHAPCCNRRALLGKPMDSKVWNILFDPNGPFGLTEGFFQNLTSEMCGFLLSAVVFSILIPRIIEWRQNQKWRPARHNFGQELLFLHVAFGESLLRFVRTPAGEARVRASEAVDLSYRSFTALNGLYGYALNADISREANDYMRELRGVRDWTYEAAHPEDQAFALVESRIIQTRDMFRHVNKEFKEVLDALGVNGYEDVRWPESQIAEMETAFDTTYTHRKRPAEPHPHAHPHPLAKH